VNFNWATSCRCKELLLAFDACVLHWEENLFVDHTWLAASTPAATPSVAAIAANQNPVIDASARLRIRFIQQPQLRELLGSWFLFARMAILRMCQQQPALSTPVAQLRFGR
jgi:hypothetical protein